MYRRVLTATNLERRKEKGVGSSIPARRQDLGLCCRADVACVVWVPFFPCGVGHTEQNTHVDGTSRPPVGQEMDSDRVVILPGNGQGWGRYSSRGWTAIGSLLFQGMDRDGVVIIPGDGQRRFA